MSDTDDTDCLLLIPPDFFLIESEDEPSILTQDLNIHDSFLEELLLKGMSANYNYLPASHQTELESINARLLQIEKNFSTASEISTISNCTVRSRFESNKKNNFNKRNFKRNANLSPTKFYHSTPKYLLPGNNIHQCGGGGPPPISLPPNHKTDGFLGEIDEFLQNNAKESNDYYQPENNTKTSQNSNNLMQPQNQPFSLPNNSNQAKNYDSEPGARLSGWDFKNRKDNDPLISLSELWGTDKKKDDLTLHEEQLRRQHCEKIIHNLQTKLLEYQQKISVAVQVDKTKDKALEKLQEKNATQEEKLKKLSNQIHGLENHKKEQYTRIEAENADFKARNDILENELTQSVDLTAKFQEKIGLLEMKVDALTKSSSEVGKIYKTQFEDLEVRVSNSKRAEEIANEELDKLKTQLARSQLEFEKSTKCNTELKKQIELFQGEVELIKGQKQNILDKYREEKNRADMLEKQKVSLHERLSDVNKKEANLLKELETQRVTLKSHYQQQLERVVAQKLKEFQSQLDAVEENLKSEARQRERTIAERAIKQMEMINEKNEQEIHLLQEKQKEEVELYRIQLANSGKTIEELKQKISSYKSRRADIAEKLHNVMETQWQKALEILTNSNPNNTESFSGVVDPRNLDREKLDGVSRQNLFCERPENESFDTPTSSREKRNDRNTNTDRLQAYIEMLLNKSPRDFENIEELLKSTNISSNNQQTKNNENANQSRRDGNGKPPWK